jgi:hypothetical protein
MKLCRMTMEAVNKPVLGVGDGISHALWLHTDELSRFTGRVIDDASHQPYACKIWMFWCRE